MGRPPASNNPAFRLLALSVSESELDWIYLVCAGVLK